MDEEQRKRFERAVERKAEKARAASRVPPGTPADAGGIHGDQPNPRSPAESQDSFSEREKGSRHRKMTADKWNQ